MIYHIIPKLVKQPTWGGDYISNAKKLDLKDIKIGQSYEFSSNSKLVPAANVEKLKPKDYPYYIGSNDVADETLKNKVKGEIAVKDIVPKEIFGSKRIPNLLIKFTQAKGNSYQIHPRENTGKFKPKAESWYFFEKGKVTLGLKPSAKLDDYKEVCQNIFDTTKKLSKAVEKKEMTIKEARKELYKYIELYNPEDFVNVIFTDKEFIIDNQSGGIHHSWEEDVYEIPEGNIVYEVQQDESDAKSTIRAFDKGKLLDDGSYRDLNINEYFDNLNMSRKSNTPDNLIVNKIRLKDIKEWMLNKIFNNYYYQMDELIVKKEYKIKNLGFRHVFVRKGEGVIKTDDEKVKISEGHSYLLPANSKKIAIKNTTKGEDQYIECLLTYIKPSEY